MPTFTVHRIGNAPDESHVALEYIDSWRVRGSDRQIRLRVRGEAVSATKADILALASELRAMTGQTAAVTFDEVSVDDGFYTVTGIDTDINPESFADSGANVLRFDLDLEWQGDASTSEIQASVTSVLVVNAVGLEADDVTFWHAINVGGRAYKGGGGVSSTVRTTADGDVPVYLDIDTATNGLSWGSSPADYYKAGAYVFSGGYRRTGKASPNTPADFVAGNGIVEVRNGATGGESNALIEVRCFDGTSWSAWKAFEFRFAGNKFAGSLPYFHHFTIVKNEPHCVIVELQRDADEAPPTDSRHVLTLTIRRGSAFVECYYTYTGGPTTWSLQPDTAEAGTAVQPGTASAAMACRATANDASGDRYVVGSGKSITVETTDGGIGFASTQAFDAFIGFAINGSSADSDNDPAALCLQYLGSTYEQTRIVPR